MPHQLLQLDNKLQILAENVEHENVHKHFNNRINLFLFYHNFIWFIFCIYSFFSFCTTD